MTVFEFEKEAIRKNLNNAIGHFYESIKIVERLRTSATAPDDREYFDNMIQRMTQMVDELEQTYYTETGEKLSGA